MSTPSKSALNKLYHQLESSLKMGDTQLANRIIRALKDRGISSLRLEQLSGLAMAITANQTHSKNERIDPLQHAKILVQLQREPEAINTLNNGITTHPNDPKLYLAMANIQRAARGHTEATKSLRTVIEMQQNDVQTIRQYAQQSALSNHPEASSAIAKAYAVSPDTWLQTYRQFLLVGDAESALAIPHQRLQSEPDDWLAQSLALRHSLWTNDTSSTNISKIQSLIVSNPLRPEGHFLMGVAEKERHPTLASNHLHKALNTSFSSETWLTKTEIINHLAEIALLKNDFDTALTLGSEAGSLSIHHNAWSDLIKQLAWLKSTSKQASVSPRWLHAIRPFLTVIADQYQTYQMDYTTFISLHEDLLNRSKGNRSETTTWSDNDGKPCILPAPKRTEVRLVQQQLRILPLKDVLAKFDEMKAIFPNEPEPETYKGEVLLWMGQYEKSKACFQAAMKKDYDTIWSWIGLGAAYGLEGNYEKAHHVFEEGIAINGSEGPTVFIYRGEFYRKQQHYKASQRDLNKALADKPQRLSAWINRALLDDATGTSDSPAILAKALQQKAPSLWIDATQECKQCPLSPQHIPTVLEHMLTMMRGNRSSQIISYHPQTGHLRFVRWGRADGPIELLEQWGLTDIN